jgi:hypothetical protein
MNLKKTKYSPQVFQLKLQVQSTIQYFYFGRMMAL